MTVSYLPATAEVSIITLRSAAVIGPTRERGGAIRVRSTTEGEPSSCSSETSASPTFNWVMASTTLILGFARKVSAAARIAFWSLAVKARSACCTRLPSCPATVSGMSIGFWLMK